MGGVWRRPCTPSSNGTTTKTGASPVLDHTLGGLFRVESDGMDPLAKAGSTLVASYEAEQHLLHFGPGHAPMCWTICGLVSGYISRTANKEVHVLEDRCMGKGDLSCHLLARTREEWSDEADEELRHLDPQRLKECLEVSLERVTETLKAAEGKRAMLPRLPRLPSRLGSSPRVPSCASSWTWCEALQRSTRRS